MPGMPATPPKKARLQELDALRGIGAVMVVIFHYATRFHEMFPRAGHVPFGFAGGNYRVLLFFAISGFAIFFSMDRLKSPADFIVNRAARLLPAYWFAICLTLGVEYIGRVTALQIAPVAIAANVTMLEAFFFLPSVDGAYWTLTVEIAFYFCMLMLWMGPGLKHMERLILGWLAVRWLWGIWPGMPWRITLLLILQYIPFFAIGMLGWRIWSGARSWRQQWPFLAFTLLTIWVFYTHDMFVVALGLTVIFHALLKGWLRFLCVRPLLWLGSISYSLYLVHQHIGFVIMLKADAAGLNPWVGFMLALGVAVGLGFCLNRYVELPAARLVRRWWSRRRIGAGDRATV